MRRENGVALRICAYGEASVSTGAMIELTVDGKKVSVPAGTSVFDAARLNDIEIPTLVPSTE